MSLLLPLPAPMGSTSHLHPSGQSPAIQSSFLRDLAANPLKYGEPVGRASFAPQAGLREVFPGPPSPPRSLLRLQSVKKGEGEREEGEVEEGEIEEENVGEEKGDEKEPEMRGTEEKGSQEKPVLDGKKAEEPKRIVLGPHLPPRLQRPRSPTPPAAPSSAESPVAGPSTLSTPKKKANGHAASPSKPPTASSSTPAKPQLHAPISDEWLSFPPALAKVERKAAGLHNPSMACYANATLQVMMHTPPFVREMWRHQKDDCLLNNNNKFCLLCVMRSMIQEHWSKKAYPPREVHMRLGQIKKGFTKNRQEDSHEFFRFACDALQNSALAGTPKNLPEATKHTTWVHRLWGGRVRSRVVCSRCSKPSDTFDHFLDLSLDCGANKRTLTAMLQGFVKDDKLEGDNKYHCESCKGKANATKNFRIAEAPPVLTLHLKRFSMNYNSWNGKARADKYNQHIGFEEYLDIAPYMVDPKAGETSTKYRLFGVTCHRGAELRFGHYTAYVRAPNGRWYEADDEDVSPVDFKDVLRDKTAYLLSYIRLAEGEEIPAGARTSGYANGTANVHAAESSAQGAKRKREEEEHEQEARRPAKNTGSGRQVLNNQPNAMNQPIRKVTPQSTPLFPSVHDSQPQTNGSTPRQPTSANYVPRNPLPSPAPSEEATSSRLPVFGSAMGNGSGHTPKSFLAPTPVPAAQFYGSPIPRSANPGPGSPGGKNRKKHKRPQGNASPFNPGGGSGGGRNGGGGRGGFRGKQRGVFGRMRGH